MLSLKTIDGENSNTDIKIYIKVQNVPSAVPPRKKKHPLESMTENFSKELGAGGFGTVFEGTLIDGTKVAVKRLNGFSQIKKSFLAGVDRDQSQVVTTMRGTPGYMAPEWNRLLDLVDKYNEDMQLHGPEVVNMMRVAARCLQNDYTKRPSMSMVVKIIEDNVNIESDLDYFFWNPPLPNMRAGVDNPGRSCCYCYSIIAVNSIRTTVTFHCTK
uniref:Protein kinase domain-containing protein n=1 Tax=Fagus sylvatica TaxID=28930 RepID=A0A2N9GIL7_FAGSY